MSDTPRTDLIKKMRHQARCIYIAVQEDIAREISDSLTQAADRIAQLERELAEEKRDAEIGRWFLRKTSYTGESDGLQYAFMGKCFGPSSLAPTTLREAIEELMKEEK